jgi:hypothetical protein
MSLTRSTGIVVLVLSACATPAEPARSPHAVAPPADTGQHEAREAAAKQRAPLQVRFEGPATPAPDDPLTLTARLTQNTATTLPLHVTLSLPAGVTLLEGTAEQTVELAREATLTFVIQAHELPPEDVVLRVGTRTQSFGMHHEARYRFGRAAAVPSLPNARGQTLRIGNKRYGRAVDITPETSR